MPENRKSGFNALPDRRQAAVSAPCILLGYQQTIVFFNQFILQAIAAVSQIANHCLMINKFGQTFGNMAVGIIARRQNTAADFLFSRCQNVQFEAEKPTLAGFTKIRAVISEKAYSWMPCRLTKRNWFGIYQIHLASIKRRRSLKYLLHDCNQPMKTANKLFVTAQSGKFGLKVFFNQRESFPQTFNSKLGLHQGNRQNFRIRKTRISVITAPPIGKFRIILQKIIHKTVDFGQFIKYLGHWLSTKANRFSWSNLYFTSLFSTTFSTSDWS